MTSTGPLNDSIVRQALLEMAAGPDAGRLYADVLRATNGTRQVRGFVWPSLLASRRTRLVGAAALLAVALLGVVIAGAGSRPADPLNLTGRTWSIVVQNWNGLAEPDSLVAHTAFSLGGRTGLKLPFLPKNATSLRGAPGGSRLLYFANEVVVRTFGLHPGPGMTPTAVFVANGDGTQAAQLALPRPIDQYPAVAWYYGALWAPDAMHFALYWNTGTCSGSADCIPDSGFDIWDRDGQFISSIPTPDNVDITGWWSPDGRAIGWSSGSCADGSCMSTAVHWRLLDGDPTITTVEGTMNITWADARLHAVTFDRDGATGVLTMAPDGTDVRHVDWTIGPDDGGPVWSPDGRWLAAVDVRGALRLRDVTLGTEIRLPIPAGLWLAAWSPDSRTIAIGGDHPDDARYSFYVIEASSGEVAALGVGDDFGWLNTSVRP